jgi:hypothetical protein
MTSISRWFGSLFGRRVEHFSSGSGIFAHEPKPETTWDDIKNHRQAWAARVREYLRRMERDQEMISSALCKAGGVLREATNSYLSYLKKTHLESKLRDLITWRNIDRESRRTKRKLDEANKLNPDTSYYDQKIADYDSQIDEIKRQLGMTK